MGIEMMGPPPELALALRDALGLRSFVETGTLHGDTTVWASSHFQEVVTIEASDHLYDEARARFAPIGNIRAIHADTTKGLYELVPQLRPTLFFLDAHWSGGLTAGTESECPLLSELAIIMPWFRKHAIMIDDARMFLKPPQPPHRIEEWPSLDEIIDAAHGTAFAFHYRDVLVMVPKVHRLAVAQVLSQLKGD